MRLNYRTIYLAIGCRLKLLHPIWLNSGNALHLLYPGAWLAC